MMIGNEGPGKDYTEAELRQVAEQFNWYKDQIGTYYTDIGKVAQLFYGMEYEQHEGLQLDELAELKQQGAELIVAVDHALLARPYLPKIATPDHVVELIGFDESDPEHPKVIINDPGRPDGQGAAYPVEMFKRASYVTNRDTGITGKQLEHNLDEVYITANKNTIPNEPMSPFVTSGLRLGTPAVTTRGLKEADMDLIAGFIADCVTDFENKADAIREGVTALCDRYPLYA